MLVLSRKVDEKIIIGDNEICVTVVDIRGDKVRLGIEASPNIQIHREEIFRAIQKQKPVGI
jgi:carbon storage regulator